MEKPQNSKRQRGQGRARTSILDHTLISKLLARDEAAQEKARETIRRILIARYRSSRECFDNIDADVEDVLQDWFLFAFKHPDSNIDEYNQELSRLISATAKQYRPKGRIRVSLAEPLSPKDQLLLELAKIASLENSASKLPAHRDLLAASVLMLEAAIERIASSRPRSLRAVSAHVEHIQASKPKKIPVWTRTRARAVVREMLELECQARLGDAHGLSRFVAQRLYTFLTRNKNIRGIRDYMKFETILIRKMRKMRKMR